MVDRKIHSDGTIELYQQENVITIRVEDLYSILDDVVKTVQDKKEMFASVSDDERMSFSVISKLAKQRAKELNNRITSNKEKEENIL